MSNQVYAVSNIFGLCCFRKYFKGIISQLETKDKEIAFLKHADSMKDETMTAMSDQLMKLTKEVQHLKKLRKG